MHSNSDAYRLTFVKETNDGQTRERSTYQRTEIASKRDEHCSRSSKKLRNVFESNERKNKRTNDSRTVQPQKWITDQYSLRRRAVHSSQSSSVGTQRDWDSFTVTVFAVSRLIGHISVDGNVRKVCEPYLLPTKHWRMTREQAVDDCFVREFETTAYNGDTITLSIAQQWIGDVGVVVWDAALLFAKFLERRSHRCPHFLTDKVALELGAGTGLCGLVAAVFGCDVILTDVSSMLPLLSANINRNKDVISKCGRKVVAHSWKWSCFETIDDVLQGFGIDILSIDYVFICDCIYYEKGMQALFESIAWFCEHCKPSLEIYLCYEERDEHTTLIETFFKKLSLTKTLQWTEIDSSEHDPCFTSQDIHLVLIKPKK